MEPTYMVRGADGKEYGPASLEQLSKWIEQGRLPTQAAVKRNDMEYWANAGDFTELQPLYGGGDTGQTQTAVAPRAAGTATASAARTDVVSAARLRSGASWFYWIAGLSLINSLASFSGSSWRFILGLGITQIFDEVAAELAGPGRLVALGLDVLTAGLFILFGFFANKGRLWAFIVGMILFALDGAIFLLSRNVVGILFHVFVLYVLVRGFNACRALRPGRMSN